MAQEIELKLALAEDAQRNFLRHPLLRQATHKQTCRLVNLYYDTPDLALRGRGVGLRLRAQGKVWLQTVKCAGRSAGGLSSRPEWETPYVGHFDFSSIDLPKVRDWLEHPQIRTHIAPIFETNFQRTTWTFEPSADTRIAVMLDRGWIAADGRRETISEVEIELYAGSERQLLDLALAFAERIPLAPAPLSKADRGYRLFKQIAPTPCKAEPVALDPVSPPAEAFRQIALGCLEHLQRNHAGAIGSENPEYIHQMRVATRRLRAALRLFGPMLPPDFADALLPALHELMDVLGRARDLDVLFAEIAQPVLEALPDEPRLAALIGIITERRFSMRKAATHYLRSPGYGRLTLEALATVHSLPVGDVPEVPAAGVSTVAATATDSPPPEAEEAAPVTLGVFANRRLRRLRKKVLLLAAQASIEDPSSLHALRIGIKRLRYALEFFAPLASPKRIRRLLEHLADLQDALGQINDLANAGEWLMDCAGNDPRLREAVTLIGGWHGPRHHRLLTSVPAGLKRLGKLRLPKIKTKPA